MWQVIMYSWLVFSLDHLYELKSHYGSFYMCNVIWVIHMINVLILDNIILTPLAKNINMKL